MTTAGILACIVFVAAVVLLIWKPIHPILIGALIPIALAVLGILDAKTAFADFANTTVVFFMSLLVVGGAIFKTGLADYLGEKLIGLVGKSERGILAGSSIVAATLSAFLNDTGTTGCLMPIVTSVANKAKVPVSKILMSLAFFASLGGTITLIGTTPHIVADGLIKEAGFEGFGFFEFAKIGLPITIVGLIYMLTIGVKQLPIKEVDESKIEPTAQRKPIKMIIVGVVFLFIVVCMATKLLPMHLAAAVGAVLVILTGCISVEEGLKSMSVTTMFLVAGIFPLSKALVETGAAEYLITKLEPALMNMPELAIYAVITLVTIVTTQFLMNTSLTAILVPIGILIAESANVNPRGVVMAIAMAASGALLTPFGTGPNLLVWEAGKYDVKDYFKVGYPIAIIFFVMTTGLCYWIYGV